MTDDVQHAPTGRRARGGADARRALRTSTEIKQAGYIRRKMKPSCELWRGHSFLHWSTLSTVRNVDCIRGAVCAAAEVKIGGQAEL